MSEASILSEQINPTLLEEPFSLVILDGDNELSTNTVAVPVELNNPYVLDLSRFVPAPILNLESFITLASSVIDNAQSRAQIVSTERVKLYQEYPPDDFSSFGDEMISFKLISREPANMDRSGSSRPERKARYSYEYINSMEPNKYIIVNSRPIDHVIEFTAWAKTATIANSRALWLERLFVNHSWAFTSKGAERFHWQRRGSDTLWTPQKGMRLHQRPLSFFLRLREYGILAAPIVRNIEFVINPNL